MKVKVLNERNSKSEVKYERGTCNIGCKSNIKTGDRKIEKKIDKSSKLEIRSRALELIGEGLVALSNESRLKIIRHIQKNKEATFGEIRRNFNLNNNTLTFHLQKLMNARIVSQPKGNRGSYQVGSLGDIMLHFLDALEDDISSSLEKILASN